MPKACLPPTSFTGICRKEGLFVESGALLSTNKPSLRQIVVKEVVRGRRAEGRAPPSNNFFYNTLVGDGEGEKPAEGLLSLPICD